MTRGMILYSGGFDSVALLHKLIVSNDFDELTVLYENSNQMCGEYERENAKEIFNLFKKRYSRKHKIKLIWEKEDVNLGWINKETNGREILLLLHLSTILRHGEHINFYIGWHKSNIKSLDISKKVLNWFEKEANDNVSINFMEDYFSGNDEHQVKTSTIKYLLNKNLFALPHTGLNESVEEFGKRKYWFDNNSKEQEVANALVSIDIFTSLDLSKIFKFKTKEQIQELYNSLKSTSKKVGRKK